MDKKRKLRVVVIIPMVVVLIVLGLVISGVLMLGSGDKATGPTSVASLR